MESTEKGSEPKIDPTTPSHNLLGDNHNHDIVIIISDDNQNTHPTDAFLLTSSDDKSSEKNNADKIQLSII